MCIILSVAYFLHVSLLRHSIQPMWLVTGNRRVHIIVLNQTKSIFIDFYIYFIAVYKFTKVYHFTLHLWSHINLHLYMFIIYCFTQSCIFAAYCKLLYFVCTMFYFYIKTWNHDLWNLFHLSRTNHTINFIFWHSSMTSLFWSYMWYKYLEVELTIYKKVIPSECNHYTLTFRWRK